MSRMLITAATALAFWSSLASTAVVTQLSSRVDTRGESTSLDVSVSFDVRAGARASMPLHHQLISLSIEFCYSIDFLGEPNSPNLFSRQLLQNVKDISGALPILRLGGNTQDKATFCENCPESLNSTYKPGSTEAIDVSFSKGLFTAMNENMPSKQEYIFGLNLGRNDINVAKAELNAASKYLDQSKVVAYELGNEPDHFTWPSYGFRPNDTWSMAAYVQQTLEWLPQLSSGKKFQYGSIAGSPAVPSDFTLVEALQLGVSKLKQVTILSSHAYQGAVCTPASAALVHMEDYVNHLHTVRYYAAYIGEIAAAKSLGLTYHMGETSSAACHGKDGVSNTMGGLLWTIDYSFYMATLGLDRILFHNGRGDYFYSFWEPVGGVNPPTSAHINPQYYSLLFHASAIAGLDSPRIHRVAHLDTHDLAHYAIYSGNQLKKMVILNTHLHNGTTESRPVKHIDLSPIFGKTMKVKRLSAPNTIAKAGMTWGTQAIDGTTGKLVGKEAWESISNGVVDVFASEAVIIETGR
ncbi:Uncharacterized protein BP5553_03110 [Venustampulla echinocandica]|uniref:Beta-glucuronidase C-terminal domain-containing protein n=1 Tax=Venustampulla echinocandica TaxID=2656787 RepID=A0A370TTA8_9HELO|nr:Uncharacterized protein BP5553_03110 [Venustampulla echinocandica]RDL38770.1 Uncharacterized protein BP5553_03110 [Venustampulla echinocandica]